MEVGLLVAVYLPISQMPTVSLMVVTAVIEPTQASPIIPAQPSINRFCLSLVMVMVMVVMMRWRSRRVMMMMMMVMITVSSSVISVSSETENLSNKPQEPRVSHLSWR